MTDDLVKRLRDAPQCYCYAGLDTDKLHDDAADRLEELEREKALCERLVHHATAQGIAARREALEEAARVADSKVKNAEDWDSSYWDQCAMRIAAAIRALKERE